MTVGTQVLMVMTETGALEAGTAAAVLDGVTVLTGATGVVVVVVIGRGATVEDFGTTTLMVVVVVRAAGVVAGTA